MKYSLEFSSRVPVVDLRTMCCGLRQDLNQPDHVVQSDQLPPAVVAAGVEY